MIFLLKPLLKVALVLFVVAIGVLLVGDVQSRLAEYFIDSQLPF